jgi:hypothetical protein
MLHSRHPSERTHDRQPPAGEVAEHRCSCRWRPSMHCRTGRPAFRWPAPANVAPGATCSTGTVNVAHPGWSRRPTGRGAPATSPDAARRHHPQPTGARLGAAMSSVRAGCGAVPCRGARRRARRREVALIRPAPERLRQKNVSKGGGPFDGTPQPGRRRWYGRAADASNRGASASSCGSAGRST